jgi:hypothetical protein
MKLPALAAVALLFAPPSAQAVITIPPGGFCCPSCLCTLSKQLLAVPAFFSLTTQTDPTQPTDWKRISNLGGWIGLIVAGADFETASSQTFDLHFAPTNQKTYGYVGTGHGGIARNSVMGDVAAWNVHYGSSYIQGVFFDVGPTFDPNQIRNVTAAYETTPQPLAFPGNPGFEGFQGYYHSLYTSTHSSYSYEVMVNASQWPNEWIVSSTTGTQGSDRALLWEDTLFSYYNHWGAMPCGTSSGTCTGTVQNPPPPWWSSPTYTTNYSIAHTIFAVTQFDVGPAMQRSWTPAENRTASLVYLYDRPQATYSGVACFLEQEVDALGGSVTGPQKTWCGTCSGNNCTGGCADLSSDPNHCGSCNALPCPAGWSCQSSQCVAPSSPPSSNCPSDTIDCNLDGSLCVKPPKKCQ